MPSRAGIKMVPSQDAKRQKENIAHDYLDVSNVPLLF